MREARTVTVDDAPAATPVTVTRPDDCDALPDVVMNEYVYDELVAVAMLEYDPPADAALIH